MEPNPVWRVYRVLSAISVPLSAFHGYKRHQHGAHPVAWAIGWALLGGLFPVLTPTIGAAQGFTTALPPGRA
jgi:hypothetical protein